MKKSRLIFLGVVLASGAGASYLVLSRPAPPPPAPVKVIVESKPVAKDHVLVAAHELTFGSVVQPTDLAWHDWPSDDVMPGVIRKSDSPKAIDDIKDSVVRGSFLTGEPIRREKLFKGGGSGFLSAMLNSRLSGGGDQYRGQRRHDGRQFHSTQRSRRCRAYLP